MRNPPPICTMCQFLDEESDYPACRAFPDGIPDEIWRGGNPHSEPLANEFPLFKQREDVPDEAVEAWEELWLEHEKVELDLAMTGE